MDATATSPADHHRHDLSIFPEGLKGKRVLLCTESFGPVNGVSRTTLMLVNHLRANGCHVAVVAPHNSTKVNTFIPKASSSQNQPSTVVSDAAGSVSSSSSSSSSSSKDIEIRLHGYPVPFNPELSIAYLVRLSTLYARTFGRATPPDLIYLASPASLGFQVLLQLRQRPARDQVPVLCNFQTDLAGYCQTLFPWPLGAVADAAFAAVQGFLFRHPSVKTVFYPSTYVRRYLARHAVPAAKTELLARGVDAQLFHPAKRSATLRARLLRAPTTIAGTPPAQVVLLCVARLAPEKSFDFLAQAARALDARGTLDFVLHIVGGNRQAEVEAEIRGLFADLEAKGRVVFAGFRGGEALAEAYASADVFLHCSVSETFGLVVLESFASGVPVVARDRGGPSDTVRDGVSGYLTGVEDLEGFVDRVVELAGDEAVRARFAEAALKQAREATWDKINNKVAWRMLDVIREREADVAEMEMGEGSGGGGEGEGGMVSAVPVFGWMMLSKAVRETVVNSRLAAALGVICGFWGVVSVYLVFTKATRWVKGLFSRSSA